VNGPETIAAMRAEVEDVKVELDRLDVQALDPVKVADLRERVARLGAAITTAERWHGLEAAK
jgi:uncharacterized small protein (DUF1192 family)